MKFLALSLALALATPWVAGAADGAIRTVVSVAPQKFLVERIGGAAVTVTALVGPGQDPHHFSLTPKQALEIGRAQVYFATGMPFEKGQLPRVRESNPQLRIVDLTGDMILMEMEAHEGSGHEGHDHAGEYDPHVWLSPPLLHQQAEIVLATLSSLSTDAAQRSAFEKNCAKLLAEIDATHEAIAAELAPFKGKAFYVFHPAFGYFADTYGLRQVSIETGGKKPTAASIVKLIRAAQADGIETLFVQPGFDQTATQQIAQGIGGAVAELDPLAPDVLGNLRVVARTLVKGFAPK